MAPRYLGAAPAGHAIDRDEIEHFIADVVHHDGGPENVKRVADKLAAAGWSVEELER